MQPELKLGLLSLIPETIAGLLVFGYGEIPAPAYSAILLHISACCLATPMVNELNARGNDRTGWWLPAVSVILMFLLPVAGILSVLIEALLVMQYPAHPGSLRHIYRISSPVFRPSRRHDDVNNRVGGLREHLLGEGDSPIEYRIRALVGLQNMQPRYSSPVLNELLGASCDDLRLLAYGMLDSSEKQISKQIAATLERYRKFDMASFPNEHFQAAKELAELHWELVYQRLVQGDVRKQTIEQAQRYASEALKGHMYDGELRFFLGKIRLVVGDFTGASSAFESALALGFPSLRIAPYLAEIAYLKRDFADVRRTINQAREDHSLTTLRQTVEYWSRP
jgi:hypothetical protein